MSDSSRREDRIEAPGDPLDPDEWTRYVDRAKLRIEESKEAREKRFLSRNSAALIAGSIAAAGILVSGIGLMVSYDQRERDLRQQNERTRFELENAARRDAVMAAEHNHKLRLDMLMFVERHERELFSCNTAETNRVRQIMKTTFVEVPVDQFFAQIEASRTANLCHSVAPGWKPGTHAYPPVAAASGPSSASPPADQVAPLLTNAEVTFHTTNDDKDADTGVSISIDCGGRPVARIFGTWGRWSDNTTFGPIALPIAYSPPKDQIKGKCQATIVEAPNGHDEWHFSWELHLKFLDGSTLDYRFDGENVDYNRRSVSRPL